MINWKVRAQHKVFWVSLVSALLILVQVVAAVFGYTIDFSTLTAKLIAVIDAVFVVLGILGIFVDPTTEGVADSAQAMKYSAPKPKE